jgi:hypothetical protein
MNIQVKQPPPILRRISTTIVYQRDGSTYGHRVAGHVPDQWTAVERHLICGCHVGRSQARSSFVRLEYSR